MVNPRRRETIDPDLARCIAQLPDAVQPALHELVSTIPLDDLLPVLRAAREGDDDDIEALFVLGRLYQRHLDTEGR